MKVAAQDKLTALPGLFQDLMACPLFDMTHGCLPLEDALFVFYTDDEPILVGSAPHVDEMQLLAPSVRLTAKIHIRNYHSQDAHPPAFTRPREWAAHVRKPNAPIKARWLVVADPVTRMMLEIFAAQKLGLTLCHPQVKKAMQRPPALAESETRLPRAMAGL